PRRELVQANLVGLGRAPREIEPPGPLVDRPDAVLPAVARDEVATRVAHRGDAELAHELEDVAAEAARVRARVAGLVVPLVDAPAQMLDEGTEESSVDRPDREGRVEAQACRSHNILLFGRQSAAGAASPDLM